MIKIYSIILIAIVTISSCQQSYFDPDLPISKRVDILLSKMTLEEKIGQLDMYLGMESFTNPGHIDTIEIQDNFMVYKNLSFADLEKRVKEGMIGSFLSIKDPKQANYLQSLTDSSRLKIPLLNCIDSVSDTLNILVTVKNVGNYDGDHTILIYVNDIYSSVTTPVKELIAFKRINLHKGEQQKVKICIPPERFSLLDKNLNRIVEPGKFAIMVENCVDTLIIK